MPVITASRNYSPGDLIHTEAPFVQVLCRRLKDVLCESCHNRAFNLRACKQCLAVKYCGRVCQKKDWKSHRLECNHLKKLPEGLHSDMVRLIGRLILKIKGEDWKTIKTCVLGTEVSFDDIDCHYKDMTENPHFNLLFKEIKELTRRYIGVENLPGDVDMLKIIGKVIFNLLNNTEQTGISFFFGMFLFEHECIPNSSFIVNRNAVKIWSNKKIDKGSEKISISFRNLLHSPSLLYFSSSHFGKCKCTDCSLPYGESVLSKILDEGKAFSVVFSSRKLLDIAGFLTALNITAEMRDNIEEMLQKQVGVLGNTNILRLKLLSLKCLVSGGHPLEIRRSLVELETSMRNVFGELYIEMDAIYEALAFVNLGLGNVFEGKFYLLKLNKLKQFK